MPADPDNPFVSRGGLKLRHALGEFGIDPAGLTCADLGCSTGGFTDCLLRAGAARVYAVDTAYGELAWSVRTDPRVRVMERTNALHAEPPEGGVDLVVIDLGWTKQALAVPAALRWLKPGGRIVTLIKPHYERPAGHGRDARATGEGEHGRDARATGKGGHGRDARATGRGRLAPLGEADAERIAGEVAASMPGLGARVLAMTRSPILGRKGGRGEGRGNVEFLALLEAAE